MKSRLPKSISGKLPERKKQGALRKLASSSRLVDFSSNDYLGFAKSEAIFNETHQYLTENRILSNGATGSRLISGNHPLYAKAETQIAKFHKAEAALIFNSGYDANLGLLSCIPQRNDIIIYDEFSHASIRDGIRLSNAKAYRFRHNDLADLENLLARFEKHEGEIYIVTESVFSMDGDSPDMEKMISLSEKYNCHLIIDEAHALGVFGNNGEGMVNMLGLEDKIFARIMTFGKGLGCHGAAVLGSPQLSEYLINFARSFIYTTGLPPHSIAGIITAYRHLENCEQSKLEQNITFFNNEIERLEISNVFIKSNSPIQSAIIPGNEKVKDTAAFLQDEGFDVRAILSPTVPEGQERLRICLHSYNSEKEITELLETFVSLLA